MQQLPDVISPLLGLVVSYLMSSPCCWGWWSGISCHLPAVWVGGQLLDVISLCQGGWSAIWCHLPASGVVGVGGQLFDIISLLLGLVVSYLMSSLCCCGWLSAI